MTSWLMFAPEHINTSEYVRMCMQHTQAELSHRELHVNTGAFAYALASSLVF